MVHKKNYRRRVFAIFLFFVAMYCIVAIRLFLLQVYQKNFFSTLAKNQYHNELTLTPLRAEITDRHGTVIAGNREVASAFITPRQLKNKKQLCAFLKKHYPEMYKKVAKNMNKHFLWLERKLSTKKANWLKDKKIKDIQFVKETQRFYPFKEMGHVVGFTDIDNNGLAGIELQFSEQLKGTPTKVRLQKDARSRKFYFDRTVLQQGSPGKPLQLTLDHTLQFLALQELEQTIEEFGAKGGAVLIMDPETGEVLSMVNHPLFDPNEKIQGSLDDTRNIIVTDCFELGSVAKALVTLAAFEEGVVEYDEEIDCQGRIAYFKGCPVRNWKHYEIMPFHDIIKYSINVGTVTVNHRLGEKFYDHLIRLGLGKKTGIQFPGERSGIVKHPSQWSGFTLTVMSFGYEFMWTLLQLGRFMSTISNGGHIVKPKILVDEPVVRSEKLYSNHAIESTKNVLEKVLESFPVKGYRLIGKTGTARMMRMREYSTKDHRFTCAGMIESGDYKRVIVTFVLNSKKSHLWARQVAAPLFHRVAKRVAYHELGHQR